MEILGVGIELWIALGTAVAAFGVWGLRKYAQLSADGKISLSEVLDAVDEAEDMVKEIADAVEDVEEELDPEAKDKLDELKEKAKDAVDDAKDKVKAGLK
jgi:DNA-binding PadR family transcriptional regulator